MIPHGMEKRILISDYMVDHISIDVTDAKQSSVPKEKFRINKYNFGTPFEDFVHDAIPYCHFQVLRPKDEEQREKALAYFKEHGKALCYICKQSRNSSLCRMYRERLYQVPCY